MRIVSLFSSKNEILKHPETEDTRKRKLQDFNIEGVSLKLMRNSTKHLGFLGEGHNFPSVVGLSSLGLWTVQNPTGTFPFSLLSLCDVFHLTDWMNSSRQSRGWAGHCLGKELTWSTDNPGVLLNPRLDFLQLDHLGSVGLWPWSPVSLFSQYFCSPLQFNWTELKEEEFSFQLAYLLGKCFFCS